MKRLQIAGFVVVICILTTIPLFSAQSDAQVMTQPETESIYEPIPTMNVVDINPELSQSQKTLITIKHTDNTVNSVIIANTSVNQYLSTLASNDSILARTPLK